MAFVPLRPAPDKVGYVGFVDDDPVYADMFAPITREALRQHEARQLVAMKALSFDDAFTQLLHPDSEAAWAVTRRRDNPDRLPAKKLAPVRFAEALQLALHPGGVGIPANVTHKATSPTPNLDRYRKQYQ